MDDSVSETQVKQILYKEPPPTPEQFLDPDHGWISKGLASSIRDWVKSDFCEIAGWRGRDRIDIVQYGATRRGKSFLAILLIYYQIVHSNYLRSFTDFYMMAEGTNLAIFILSFNYKKVHEIYLSPLFNMMEASERCHRVKFIDDVAKHQSRHGTDVLVWSKAALVGEMTLASGLQLVTGNDDALNLVGNNILSAFISEINFWCEYSGTTEDSIFRTYSDVRERIKATVGNRAYLSWVYLDSSANHTDSIIEKHILKDLIPDPNTFSRWDSRWQVSELIPKLYPEFGRTGETFRVFLGNSEHPPRILHDGEVVDGEVIDVPIDAIDDFKKNLVKSIRDIAGRPTVSEMKFIPSESVIEGIFADLWNVEAGVVSDSMSNTKLWDYVQDIFVWTGARFCLRRAPEEPRFIAVDLAHAVKGCPAGITMLHKEQLGHEVMYVVDFSFAILPGNNGINLDSISEFIVDLAVKGGVGFAVVSSDTFYKESVFQRVKKALFRVECRATSVVSSLDPYVHMLQVMLSNRVVCGYNEFLYNNLRSLYRTRDKKGKEVIDHSMGQSLHVYTGRGCGCGIHEKDVSDTLAAALWNAYTDEILPRTVYEAQASKPQDLGSLIDRFYGKDKIQT